MLLPKEITEILNRFTHSGFEAFVVGGSVRDAMLGISPLDFDITTSATPEEVEAIFADKRVIKTGIEHGTVTLIWDKMPVEITTYRVESGYSDSRHPDKVEFSRNIKDDLSRRDFTVNAICYSPRTGYYDPFFGTEDINAKILRTVGNPKERFKEDALRILRMLRFASILGFEIEKETANAAFFFCGGLKNISKERIMAEFKKALCGKAVAEVFEEYFKIIKVALELDNTNKKPDFSLLKRSVGKDLSFAFAVFMLCVFEDKAAQEANKVLTLLKSDNKLKQRVLDLLQGFSSSIPETKAQIKAMLYSAEPDVLDGVFELWSIFDVCAANKTQALKNNLSSIINNNECYRISHLKIGGDELLKMGIPPKEIGVKLKLLLDAVVAGNCKNEKNTLVEYLNATIK